MKKKHIATCACLNDSGKCVGTHYMYSIEDIRKAVKHYSHFHGSMKRFRWRNDEVRAEFEPELMLADAPDHEHLSK